MENENIEQLITEPEMHDIQPENSESSIYGKFKDAETLLEAYNSLEAEFTRKSQKLADIQKELDNYLNDCFVKKVPTFISLLWFLILALAGSFIVTIAQKIKKQSQHLTFVILSLFIFASLGFFVPYLVFIPGFWLPCVAPLVGFFISFIFYTSFIFCYRFCDTRKL